jgi:hypothetical protein
MSTATVLKNHPCGRQITFLELPDIVYMKLQGQVTLEEAKLINQAHLEYSSDVSYFFYLIDLSELDDLPASVRREASAAVKDFPLRGTVIINAPLRAKVLAKLLLTAANLFRKGQPVNPVFFADSEEEGRGVIEKQRKHVLGAAT